LTEAPWFVTLAIPIAAFPSPRPVYAFLALAAGLGLLAIAFAMYASRRLTRPIAALAGNAERLLQGQPMDLSQSSSILDIERLRAALIRAAESVHLIQQGEVRAAVAEERARASAEAAQAVQALNATLEQRVKERTADLQRLTGELALTEQRERQRLAHVLHDGLQQLLVGAKLRATILNKHGDPTVQTASRDIEKLLEEALASSRSLTAELSPTILEHGLIPALQWLATWMQEKHGLMVHLDTDAPVLPLTNPVRLMVFHAVRELLFNVTKHANVREARVAVHQHDGTALIMVADAGTGFDPQTVQSGFGLFSVRERLEYVGGRLDIASAPGQGSRFTLIVPLQPVPPAV
jgi:signal transduction histidine kinase